MNAVPLFSQPRARLQPGSEAPVWTLAEAAQSLPGVLQRELETVVTGYWLALSVLTGPGQGTQNKKNIKWTEHNTETERTLSSTSD